MMSKTLILRNKFGLHTRAAAKFVTEAARYSSEILITYGNKQANGKSIMALMTLAACNGTELELTVTGEDEALALAALETLINDKFGEE